MVYGGHRSCTICGNVCLSCVREPASVCPISLQRFCSRVIVDDYRDHIFPCFAFRLWCASDFKSMNKKLVFHYGQSVVVCFFTCHQASDLDAVSWEWSDSSRMQCIDSHRIRRYHPRAKRNKILMRQEITRSRISQRTTSRSLSASGLFIAETRWIIRW